MFSKLMHLSAFYADNLCFKWRFKRGVLTGEICQKWADFMPGRVGMSVLDSELKLYLLIRTLHIIGWKLYVIVLVLRDHYHSFKMVKKAFGGILKKDCLKRFTKVWVFKRQDVFKKTDKLAVLLNYASMILLYRLIFELSCVWWN